MAKTLWRPNQINNTHMMKFMDRVNDVYSLDIKSYQDLHNWSVKNIPEFWEEIWNQSEIIHSSTYTDVIDDLHKIAKALLIYETLSGDEIRDLILKNIKPTRSFKEEDNDEGKSSSALGSLGLKPKPAV